MLFDKFAGYAERHGDKELVQQLQEAMVINFPYDNRSIGKALSFDEVSDQYHHMVLPGRVTAIEDLASCLIIIDNREDNMGMIGEFDYYDILPVKTKGDEYIENSAVDLTSAFGNDSILVTVGKILNYAPTAVDGEVKHSARHYAEKVMVVSKKRGLLSEQSLKVEDNPSAAYMRGNFHTALDELMFAFSKKTVLLQETPRRYHPDKASKGKILRTDKRPTYTSLFVHEAVNLLQGKNYTHDSFKEVRSHYRRAHSRTLKHARYAKDEQGNNKVIYVKKTWIGTEELTTATKHYKVCLDY